jgi:hypothetical protein
VVTLVASIAVLFEVGENYNLRNTWPEKVQREVLSHGADLVLAEQDFAWGQGRAKWRYESVRMSGFTRKNCRQALPCSFSRQRWMGSDVHLIGTYRDGTLVLEEWWM